MPITITIDDAEVTQVTIFAHPDGSFMARVEWYVTTGGARHPGEPYVLHSADSPGTPKMPAGWETNLRQMLDFLSAQIQTAQGI